MDTVVGSYQAKTHLPELLERVSKGERITITKRGKAVAMLIPIEAAKQNVDKLVAEMLEVRNTSGPKLGAKYSIRNLINEGRRF